MNDVAVHLTRAARDSGVAQDSVRAAAKAALMQIDAPANIQFLQFTVGRTSFAMSAS